MSILIPPESPKTLKFPSITLKNSGLCYNHLSWEFGIQLRDLVHWRLCWLSCVRRAVAELRRHTPSPGPLVARASHRGPARGEVTRPHAGAKRPSGALASTLRVIPGRGQQVTEFGCKFHHSSYRLMDLRLCSPLCTGQHQSAIK